MKHKLGLELMMLNSSIKNQLNNYKGSEKMQITYFFESPMALMSYSGSSILPELEPSYCSTVETENLPLSEYYIVKKFWMPFFLYTERKDLRGSNNDISG